MTPLLAALVALSVAAGQAADFVFEEETDLLAFSYGWPAAVEAIPALRDVLRAEMEAERRQARQWAEEGRATARENGLEFQPHHYSRGWQVAGDTPQLLSLTASEESFSGGAHGNIAFAAILWDRGEDRRVSAAEVLGQRALERMTDRYCASLDAERSERRGEPVRRDAEDPHTLCPPIAEQLLVPKDSDGDGRFDTLDIWFAPYAAGSYAEGAYFAEVPFRARDLADIRDAYRDAFEEADAAPGGMSDADCPRGDRDLPDGPGSVCIGRLADHYSFAFAWPAEAAAIPALDALLRAEAARQEAWLRGEVEAARPEREEAGGEAPGFSYEEGWTLDADRPELAAASGSATAYTGGAHGGLAYHTILVDRSRGSRIALADLFADRAAGLAALQASFCRALLAEVRDRRGETADVECPALAEHPVTLVEGEDGRIGALTALLNPYVIGSWSEGPYEVSFPVTPATMTALKPEYRGAFAARPDARSATLDRR